MLLIIGWVIVFASVIGGFMMAGGNPMALFVVSEYVVILGVMIGYVVGGCPPATLKLLMAQVTRSFKGSRFKKDVYLDLIKAFYELLMVAREQGMVGIEEHVIDPERSTIFTKYPSFLNDHHAVLFMQDALRPLIDGRAKGEELRQALSDSLDRMHAHHAAPMGVLSKAGDALPGIGIVAAVLGIIITMGSIAGDKAEIGEHVAHALVGTFLGILVSYGFIQPLGIAIEFGNQDEMSYYEIMCAIIVSYATGAPPIMASEAGRKLVPPDRQPTSEELESLLKQLVQRKQG